MDDFYNVRRLALILAVQAEIEGMKSENETRKQANHSMAYTDTDFQNKAENLKQLATIRDDQITEFVNSIN